MAYTINKTLAVPDNGMYQPIYNLLLRKCEQLTPFRISHIVYRELKPRLGFRRFHVTEAFSEWCKDGQPPYQKGQLPQRAATSQRRYIS